MEQNNENIKEVKPEKLEKVTGGVRTDGGERKQDSHSETGVRFEDHYCYTCRCICRFRMYGSSGSCLTCGSPL